ncbi:MAG: hypothetical protein ACRD7E_09930 [Bryobacteraceae bacterium]
MTIPIPIAVLPFVLGILVKVSAFTLDPRLVRNALDELAAIPAPNGQKDFNLDADRRNVIVRRLGFATLKSSTILTWLSSFVAVLLLVYEQLQLAWVLVIMLVSLILLLIWVFPANFRSLQKKWLKVRGDVWLLIVFCTFDAVIGAITVLCT